MPTYSTDPLFDEFASLALNLGGQPGKIAVACAGVADGDDTAWNTRWTELADRLVDEANRSVAGRTPAATRQAYLRAIVYYAIGYHSLYGSPMPADAADRVQPTDRGLHQGRGAG